MGDVGSAFTSGLSGLGSSIGNMFSGGGSSGGSAGGIGSDFVAGGGYDPSMFGGLTNSFFNSTDPTGTVAAQASITPPAQAAQAARTGQDPSSNVGGAQSQVASTGPSGDPNKTWQEQKDQDDRAKAIDELRREIKRRQQHLQQPWTIGGAQAQPGDRPPPFWAGASPPASQRDTPAPFWPETPAAPEPAPAEPEAPPAAPEQGSRPGTLPKGGGAPPPSAPEAPVGGGGGLGDLARGAASGAGIFLPEIVTRLLGPVGTYFGSTTPAETGELPSKYWPKPQEWPDSTSYAPGGLPQIPATEDPEQPGIEDPKQKAWRPGQPKPKDPPVAKKAAPKAAAKPHQVWVPPTPGHYEPQTGNARGPARWVPGTPGHYATLAGRKRPTEAAAPDAGVHTRKSPEAAPEPRQATGGLMAGTQTMSPMLRDMLGIAMPVMLEALASGGGRHLARMPLTLASLFGARGAGGFPSTFRGGPLNAGYYPNRNGGIGYHPGGYHPGWGGAGGGDYKPTGNPFMDTLVGLESSGYGHAWGDRGQGNARGYIQIQDATWGEFAPAAGVDLNRFPTADRADQDTQLRVGMTIPIHRFGGRTRYWLHQKFGAFDERETVGQLMQRFGGSTNIASGGSGYRLNDPNPDPLTSHQYPAPGETVAPQPGNYTGPDQPAEATTG